MEPSDKQKIALNAVFLVECDNNKYMSIERGQQFNKPLGIKPKNPEKGNTEEKKTEPIKDARIPEMEKSTEVEHKEMREGVAIKDLVRNGEVHLNFNDLDYQAARDLMVYLLKNSSIKSIDCEGIFARSNFEQDELIDLLKSRGITLKNYHGIGRYFLQAGVEVDFYTEDKK